MHRHRRELEEILTAAGELEVEWIGKSDATVPPPADIWRQFTGYDTWPTRRIPFSAAERNLPRHLSDALAFLQDPARFYLSLGGLGSLWARVATGSRHHWLVSLFAGLENRELVVVDARGARGLSLTEEEYEYYLYLFHIRREGQGAATLEFVPPE